jgi:hypothetical protein
MPTKASTSLSSNEQLDRIEKAILGNGREGLIARTARIEEKLEVAREAREEIIKTTETTTSANRKAIKDVSDKVTEVSINVIKLEEAVKAHINTDHLSVMMKKKSFWMALFLMLIAVNLMALYVPNLWDFIMRILGIPKLIVPMP